MAYHYYRITTKGGSLSLRREDWAGSSALDTAIYQGSDLIGVVQDNTSIQLTSYYFNGSSVCVMQWTGVIRDGTLI